MQKIHFRFFSQDAFSKGTKDAGLELSQAAKIALLLGTTFPFTDPSPFSLHSWSKLRRSISPPLLSKLSSSAVSTVLYVPVDFTINYQIN